MNWIQFIWLTTVFWFLPSQRENRSPLFFDLEVDSQNALVYKNIGEVMEEDFIAPLTVELVSESDKPIYYESNIQTTVCDDEVCEVLFIRLFWDLAGTYVGYDTLSGHPLTKFDHKPFSEKDYVRLHDLLQNDGSILKFKEKSELIDKKEVRASDVVDGTTGATALEIKEEVVEGALYSSYTLWHLAYNGSVKNLIVQTTEDLIDHELLLDFLTSERSDYQLMGVQNLKEQDYYDLESEWLHVLKIGIPLLRKHVMNNLPESLWEESRIQENICLLISDFDVNSRTLLIKKLAEREHVSSQSLENISMYFTSLNKNQITEFLNMIKDRSDLTLETTQNLSKSLEDSNFKYSYLIRDFIN